MHRMQCRGGRALLSVQCAAEPVKPTKKSAAAAAAESKAKEKRSFLLQLTPEERAEQKEPLLVHAESAIADYCVSLPEDSEEQEQCWLAYDYFEHRKATAEEGCDPRWGQGRLGPECQELESFESFVRQLLGYTPIKSVVRMMYGMRKHEEQERKPKDDAEGKAEIAVVDSKDGKPQYELVGAPEDGKERLVALFGAMDKDGNGKLDAQEFRDAMDKLSNDHLPGATVGTIFTAMDLHGAINLDDFLQIVEAEEMNANTPVTRWLRAHKGESPLWGNPIETM